MRLKNLIEEVYRSVMEALESRGVVREIKTVEIRIQELRSKEAYYLADRIKV
ncbi:MAG: hypothetical protein LZ172_03380 [Thaumarchaeota archaeon]|jgi:hypothetical protein|nr:hypothetical protein [Candidatus Geocrenenecus arthurdayi]MCL7390222.1 hypothetical protein [Candidatus Geocrenenecus arthurdayi]MCL7390858.1 hypothetical protein [Candidatus Geocrenenecus arthurdayi]MCL7397272.1 hypothetical protein [Candidatus Geocrenenecus arthurdayi]MCL7403373.1 hypothetical protein [Candidatus Geocrenenecus arthurdayi]